jgi:phosphate transport system ATP-binding protein
VTVVVVTHNMAQAARVSDFTAFLLADSGEPGRLVEYGPTPELFSTPNDPRTEDYIHGRFG